MSYLVSFFFLCFFSPFSIAITSHGEERANLSAFRTFFRFVLVWICRFPLAVVCDCCTPWTFLLPFFFISYCIISFVKCLIDRASPARFKTILTEQRSESI